MTFPWLFFLNFPTFQVF